MPNYTDDFCESFMQYVAEVVHQSAQRDIDLLRNGPSNKFEREMSPNLQTLSSVQFTEDQLRAFADLLTGVRENILAWFLRQIDQPPQHLPSCPQEMALVNLDTDQPLCMGKLADSLSYELMLVREKSGKPTYVGLF